MPRSNDEIANLCLHHAWNDEIDDHSRWLLELAAKRINRLGKRCVRLGHMLECAEGDIAELLDEIRGETECHYVRGWLNAAASLIYGIAALASAILRNAMAAVLTQSRLLAGNLASVIRRLMS